MRALEKKTGKKFGGGDDPLLVSVASGRHVDAGMMDTILNSLSTSTRSRP